LEKSLLVEKRLRLKVGTQVMCVVNLDDTIVNGSQGIIEGFIGGLPMVQFRNGEKRIMSYNVWQSETYKSVALAQIPLIYAWGITIHKSQGCSLDVAEIDVGDGIFECGQTYVALSRVKSLAGLYLTAFNLEKIKVNGKVHAFYQALAAGDSSTMTK
jgi:ATP-dependent DNA helicase PIF1